jgi:hypothetical protein
VPPCPVVFSTLIAIIGNHARRAASTLGACVCNPHAVVSIADILWWACSASSVRPAFHAMLFAISPPPSSLASAERAERMEVEKEAVKIQTNVRAWLLQRNYKSVRQSVTRLQAGRLAPTLRWAFFRAPGPGPSKPAPSSQWASPCLLVPSVAKLMLLVEPLEPVHVPCGVVWKAALLSLVARLPAALA